MSLGTLSIDIEARLARLETGMDKATRVLEQRNKRIETAFAGAARAASGFVAIVGGLGLTAFARNVLDGVDALNDFADATGTSVENASALEDVALRTGTSFETAEQALVRFNAQLSAAKPGSDAARVFEQLGLDAAKLRELDPAEALLQTAKALSQYADDGNKARLVQELFGKSVREVAPFLKDLAEAGQLNATVTTEQAKAAEAFANAIRGLQKDLSDMARTVLGEALPAVSRFLREITAAQASGGVLSRVFRWQREAVPGGTDTENLLANRDQLANVQGRIAAVQSRMQAGGDNQFRRDQLASLQKDAEQLASDMRYYERLLGITGVQGGRGSIVPGGRPSVGALADAAKKGKAPAGAGVADFGSQAATDALRRLEAVDTEKIAELRDQLERLVRIGVGGDARGFEAARQVVDELVRLDPAARAAAEAQKDLDKALDEGRRLYEQTRTPAEQLAGEIERLNKLLSIGAIDWDTYARAQFEAQDRFDQASGAAKTQTDKLADTAKDLGMTFSSAFEDAIIGGQKFSDVLKGLEQDITRILVRKLVTEPLAEGITGAIKGAGGGGGGLGQLIGSLFSGFFAGGGYIPPGRWGVVGERGPEVAYGGRSGMSVQQGSSVVVNVQGGGGMGAGRMTAMQQGQVIGRQVQLALRRNG
jgi:tetratricopeptide (TPR) repeat protein